MNSICLQKKTLTSGFVCLATDVTEEGCTVSDKGVCFTDGISPIERDSLAFDAVSIVRTHQVMNEIHSSSHTCRNGLQERFDDRQHEKMSYSGCHNYSNA